MRWTDRGSSLATDHENPSRVEPMRSRARRPHIMSPIAWAVLAIAIAGVLTLTASLQLLVVHATS